MLCYAWRTLLINKSLSKTSYGRCVLSDLQVKWLAYERSSHIAEVMIVMYFLLFRE